ncbi:MAG: glycosyltransferase family 2 protein, partial [Nitrospiraceae bacterium]
MRTPVAFIIFNRPDTTERVFAEIANARPAKLFVIADG